MTISTSITVDGSSAVTAHAVAFGTPVTLGLTSTVGVASCTYDFPGASRADAPVLTVTYGGTVGVATFSISGSGISDGAGCSYILRATLNGGLTNGRPDPSLIKTVVLGVPNAFGVVPISAQETTQRDATIGWTYAFNQLIGAAAMAGADKLESVRYAVAESSLTSGMSTVITSSMADGVTPAAGDEILIYGDVQSANQGTWVLNASKVPDTRRAADEGLLFGGTEVYVREGTAQGKKVFRQTRDAAVNFGEPMRWTRTDFLGGVESDGFAYARVRNTGDDTDLPVIAVNPTSGEVQVGGEETELLFEVDFSTPGTTVPTARTGEPMLFARTGTAPVYVNGVEVIAAANQPRITREGLLVEPAVTNKLASSTDLTTASWVVLASGLGRTLVASPDGDNYTRLTQTATIADQGIYQVTSLTAVPQTFQCIVRKATGGGAQYLAITDNSYAHKAVLDITTGLIVTASGTGTRAEVYDLGDEFLLSLSVDAGLASGLVMISHSSNGVLTSFGGDPSKYIDVRRPMVTDCAFPTSFTSGSRGAETARFAIARQLPPDCSITVEYEPAWGSRNDRGAVQRPLVNLGTYARAGATGANNDSLEVAINNGTPVLATIDGATGLRSVTGRAMAAGTSYRGQRVVTAYLRSAAGITVDGCGKASIAAASGAGSGVVDFAAYPQKSLRIGYSADGAYGGVLIKRIRICKGTKARENANGSFVYGHARGRGHSLDAEVIACLGDSNTDCRMVGAGITRDWPQIACDTKGGRWQRHNYGVSGDTTPQLHARWREHVRGRGYKTVTYWCGINDKYAERTTADIVAQATATLAEIKADGVTKIIVIGLLPGSDAVGGAGYLTVTGVNSALSALCTAQGYLFVDTWALFSDNDPTYPKIDRSPIDYDYDGTSVHLSQLGGNLLGATVGALL